MYIKVWEALSKGQSYNAFVEYSGQDFNPLDRSDYLMRS